MINKFRSPLVFAFLIGLCFFLPLAFKVQGPFHFRPLDLLLLFPLFLSYRYKGWQKVPFFSFSLFFPFLLMNYAFYQSANITALLAGLAIPALYGGSQFFLASIRCFRKKQLRNLFLLSASTWILFALAFPPLPLGFSAWFVLVPWFFALDQINRKEGAILTFWAGVLFNGINLYWIYNVAKVGPAVAVLGGLFLLISYLSLFNVFSGWLFQSIPTKWRWLFFPFAWVGVEILRTRGEISFPWLHISYTQGNFLSLIQSSALIGVFGLGLLLIFSNLFTYHIVFTKRWKLLPLLLLLPGLLFISGEMTLRQRAASSEFAKVALMQPNVLQKDKWGLKNFATVLKKNWAHLDPLQASDSIDIIAFPETAIPNFRTRVPSEFRKLQAKADATGADLLMGVLDVDFFGPPPKNKQYYNTGRLLRARSQEQESYKKIFLVPFSERLPFDNVLPIINYLDFGEGDFTPGTEVPLYVTNSIPWTPNICYETIYPYFVRDQVKNGSRLIVNITNDAWFGLSTEPYQHLNLVRFRAVENGIPIARSTNTGISAVIDEYGVLLDQAEIYQDTMIVRKIPLKTRTTFYSNWGGMIENILFYSFLILLFYLAYLNKRSLFSTLQKFLNPYQ